MKTWNSITKVFLKEWLCIDKFLIFYYGVSLILCIGISERELGLDFVIRFILAKLTLMFTNVTPVLCGHVRIGFVQKQLMILQFRI